MVEEGKEMSSTSSSVPREDGKRMHSLNARLEQYIARARLDDDRLKGMKQFVADLRARMEDEKKRACAELQKQLDQERANVQKLSTAYGNVTHQLNVKRENVTALKRDLSDTETECNALKEQLERLTGDLTSEKTEQEATREAHTKVSQLLKDAIAKNQKLEESLTSVRRERNTLKTEKTRLESMHGLTADDLKHMRAKWMEEVNSLKNQVTRLKTKQDKMAGIFLEKYNDQLTQQTAEIERQKSEQYAQVLLSKEAFYEKRLKELQHDGSELADQLEETKAELLELRSATTLDRSERDRLLRELDVKSESLDAKSKTLVEERQNFHRERQLLHKQVVTLKAHYVSLEKEYNELKKNKLEFVAAIGNTKAILDDEDRRWGTNDTDVGPEGGEDVDEDVEDLLKYCDDEIKKLRLPAVADLIDEGKEAPKPTEKKRSEGETEVTGKSRRGRRATVTTGGSSSSSSSSSSSNTGGGSKKVVQDRRRRSAADTVASRKGESGEITRKRKRTTEKVTSSSSTTTTTTSTRRTRSSGGGSALDPPTAKAAPTNGEQQQPAPANGVGLPPTPAENNNPPAPKRQRTNNGGGAAAAPPSSAAAKPLVVYYDRVGHAIVAKNVSDAPLSLDNYRLSIGGKVVRLQRDRILQPGEQCFFYATIADADKYGGGKKMKVAFGENAMKFTPGMESSICLESPEGVMTMVEDSKEGSSCLIM